VIVTHLTTTVFLYQKHHPEDGQITGSNIIKIHHKIKVHLLVGHSFHKSNILFGKILLNGDDNANSYLNLSLLIISVFIQSRVTI
jgi:hypothetical protein